MYRRLLTFIITISFCTNAFALNVSRVKTWTNEVLTASDLNAEFDNIINHSIANADISATAAITGSKLDLSVMSAIGGSSPAAGTFTALIATSSLTSSGTLAVTSTSALTGNVGIGTAAGSNALTVNGTVAATTVTGAGTLPSGAVFFMASGSCPSWTTDVSSTYSNKYVKINATPLTSAGVVFTATTDAHQLTASEIPSLPLTYSTSTGPGGGTVAAYTLAGSAVGTVNLVNSGVTASSFTHTISTATTLEPSSVTMKACQVT